MSTMADSEAVVGGADDPGLARLNEERLDDWGLDDEGPGNEPGSHGEIEAAGAAGADAVCSMSGLGAETGTWGAVVGGPGVACGAVVGLLEYVAVGGGQSSPKTEPALEFRLVTLNQLTGRTLVLGCVIGGAEVFVPSGPAGLCESLEKAALSLPNNAPTFFSPPNEEVKDLLLSWLGLGCCIRCLLSSPSRCFLCLSSSFFLKSSSSLFFRSSSFLRCLSMSLDAVLGRNSCGTKPDGYETMWIECGRR